MTIWTDDDENQKWLFEGDPDKRIFFLFTTNDFNGFSDFPSV